MGGHPMHTYCAEVQALLMCLVLSAKLHTVCELCQVKTGVCLLGIGHNPRLWADCMLILELDAQPCEGTDCSTRYSTWTTCCNVVASCDECTELWVACLTDCQMIGLII
jgi:hypothetical protein